MKEIEGEDRYGFLIKLLCRTPNAGRVGFVTRTFKEKLRELGRVQDRGFYINRIWLTKGRDLAASTPVAGERAKPAARPSRGRGRGRGRTGPAPPSNGKDASKVEEIIDPVTDEVMNGD